MRRAPCEPLQSFRPVGISHECAQHWRLKNFRPAPICGAMVNFSSQPSELGTTRWVIEAGLERQQKVISKEKDRPFTEQQPLVRPVRRIAVGLHLVNDNRLNGKLVIWLNDSAVSEAERMRIRQTDSWPVDCSGEVRRVALAILQRQVVVST